MQNKLKRLEALAAEAVAGGGPDRVASQHGKGKLTARERLELKVLEVDPIHHRIVLAALSFPDEPLRKIPKPVIEPEEESPEASGDGGGESPQAKSETGGAVG